MMLVDTGSKSGAVVEAGRVYGNETREGWLETVAALNSGAVVEVSKEVFYYFLEVLPPVFMNQRVEVGGVSRYGFGFAEGADWVIVFWGERDAAETRRYFGQRSEYRNETRACWLWLNPRPSADVVQGAVIKMEQRARVFLHGLAESGQTAENADMLAEIVAEDFAEGAEVERLSWLIAAIESVPAAGLVGYVLDGWRDMYFTAVDARPIMDALTAKRGAAR